LRFDLEEQKAAVRLFLAIKVYYSISQKQQPQTVVDARMVRLPLMLRMEYTV
jgi:hypothetical protein